MSKQTGLGSAFWVSGNDLSGDVQQVNKCSGSQAVIDVTDITQSAYERRGGIRDGAIDWTSYFDPTTAHPVLSALPTADVLVSYIPPTVALGNPACAMVAKQINYDPTRAHAGDLTVAVSSQANGDGLEWGKLATPGKRTDGAATNGTGVDDGASTAFGLQAYLHLFAFTGTDVTIKLQDSADNVTFADLAGAAFAQVTGGAPAFQRIVISNAATVRRYLRVATVTTGGFSNAVFAVIYDRNAVAGVSF